jgi:aspartate kinase
MEDVKVRAITHNGNVVKVVFLEVPDRPGIAALIFKELADCSVSVDMIIQSEGREDKKDVAFVVSREDENRLKKVIANLNQKIQFKGVKLDEAVAKISIVGAGIASDPNIAYRMFHVLSEQEINIDMISTSNLRISCLIPNSSINEAVQALHKEFIEDEEVSIHEEL